MMNGDKVRSNELQREGKAPNIILLFFNFCIKIKYCKGVSTCFILSVSIGRETVKNRHTAAEK